MSQSATLQNRRWKLVLAKYIPLNFEGRTANGSLLLKKYTRGFKRASLHPQSVPKLCLYLLAQIPADSLDLWDAGCICT